MADGIGYLRRCPWVLPLLVDGPEEEGNGDEFMSWPIEDRQSGEQFQLCALPERVVAKPKEEFTSIHIIIMNVDAGEMASES
jgi:hypothetical protein